MADRYDIQRGWRLWIALSQTDDIGRVLLNGEVVCQTAIRGPEAEVELTNVLVMGPNQLAVHAENTAPRFWKLRHQIRVRDLNGNAPPHIPDGRIDITGTGTTPHSGIQQSWEYVFTVS
jgi:hypothetical protein